MKSFLQKLVLAIFIPRLFLAVSILIFSLLLLFSIDNLAFLQPVKNFLNSDTLSITINEDNYSVYDGLRFILLSTAFFSVTGFVIDLADKGINKLSKLNSVIFNSNTINRISLISKIFLFVLFIIIGLNILGVDLSSLAFLTSALVVGIGFGLQKIISNYVSGIILLFDSTIENEDIIQLNDNGSGVDTKAGDGIWTGTISWTPLGNGYAKIEVWATDGDSVSLPISEQIEVKGPIDSDGLFASFSEDLGLIILTIIVMLAIVGGTFLLNRRRSLQRDLDLIESWNSVPSNSTQSMDGTSEVDAELNAENKPVLESEIENQDEDSNKIRGSDLDWDSV